MKWLIGWAQEDEQNNSTGAGATVDLLSIAKPAKEGRKLYNVSLRIRTYRLVR